MIVSLSRFSASVTPASHPGCDASKQALTCGNVADFEMRHNCHRYRPRLAGNSRRGPEMRHTQNRDRGVTHLEKA